MTFREAMRKATLRWWHIIALIPLIPLVLPLVFLLVYGLFVMDAFEKLRDTLDNLER